MELTGETFDDVSLIRIDCDHIDASNVEDFKASMRDVLTESRRLVLDFTDVRFLDSAALAALLWILRNVETHGGDVRLCRAAPQVRAVLELVRLDQLIEMFSTAEAAVRSFDTN